MKNIFGMTVPLFVLAIASGSVMAQSSLAVKEDAAQLRADKAALQRQIQRLDADEAKLKSDTASGRLSAQSKDAQEVYMAKEAIKGEQKAISHDKAGSLQMQSDKAALQRQMKLLEMAEARLKSDTAAGKMSAMSKDSEMAYKDQQAVKSEQKQVAADKAKLQADQKK